MNIRNLIINSNALKYNTLLNFAVQVMFGVLIALKGNLDSYLSIVFILFTVCETVLVYGYLEGANRRLIWAIILLINIGVCIQNILGQTSSIEMGYIMMVCLVATSGYAFVEKRYLFDKKMLMFVSAGFSLFTLLALILFGKSINGTKAWISIGNISIQMSDLVKLAFVYFNALLYSTDYKENVKFKISTIFFVVISGLLILINELGTILVTLVVYLTMIGLFIKERKHKIIVVSSLIIGAFLVAVLYIVTVHYTSVIDSIGLSKLKPIFEKVTDRISVWINFSGTKYEDYGYQALKAKQGALIGGWFGTSEYNIHIPIATSDFIFPAILMHLGLAFGLIVILLFFIIYYRINYAKSTLKIVSLTALCGQAFIMIAGSINFFVMTGLGIPFLSSGGTNTLVTYILTYNILSRRDMTYEK